MKKNQKNHAAYTQHMLPEKGVLSDSLIPSMNLFQPDAGYIPDYVRKNGFIFTADSLQWFPSLRDSCIDLVYADPPYNIKKADWDRFESQEEYITWSMRWIREAARVLKPSGSLYICGFSEILADLKRPAMQYFSECRWLVWNYKNKANLKNDWGRSHESILHFRKTKKFQLNVDEIRIPYSSHTLKYPSHPQAESSQYARGKPSGTWTPHPLGAKPKDVFEIPTICNGMKEKTPHPTQKPEELLRKLILAASQPGGIVLDPFSGSGTTLTAAEQLGRFWIGCDMNAEYNSWAAERIDGIHPQPVCEWIALDKENARRRASIR